MVVVVVPVLVVEVGGALIGLIIDLIGLIICLIICGAPETPPLINACFLSFSA